MQKWTFRIQPPNHLSMSLWHMHVYLCCMHPHLQKLWIASIFKLNVWRFCARYLILVGSVKDWAHKQEVWILLSNGLDAICRAICAARWQSVWRGITKYLVLWAFELEFRTIYKRTIENRPKPRHDQGFEFYIRRYFHPCNEYVHEKLYDPLRPFWQASTMVINNVPSIEFARRLSELRAYWLVHIPS